MCYILWNQWEIMTSIEQPNFMPTKTDSMTSQNTCQVWKYKNRYISKETKILNDM